MRSNLTSKAAIVALAMAFALPASAQYTGPSSEKKQLSVAEILKHPADDQQVVLRGVLTKKEGHEKYLFSDGTGEIRVEIDDKRFPSQKIDEKTRVEIRGEVDKDMLKTPEIDVKSISVVP